MKKIVVFYRDAADQEIAREIEVPADGAFRLLVETTHHETGLPLFRPALMPAGIEGELL